MKRKKTSREPKNNTLAACLKDRGVSMKQFRDLLNKGIPEGDPRYIKQSCAASWVMYGGRGRTIPGDEKTAKRVIKALAKIGMTRTIKEVFPTFEEAL